MNEEKEPEEQKEQFDRGRARFARGFLTGVIAMAAVLVVLVLVGRVAGSGTANSGTDLLDEAAEEKIQILADYIDENYYEEVETEELREGLYQGLFDNLDIYSCYYTPEEYDELVESQIEGTFSGIGAGLQQDQETMTVTVIYVYDDSPAKEAGLQPGDILYKVDDYDASSMELSELVTHIRGEENTSVHLEIYRDGEFKEFDVERRDIDYQTVAWEMFDDDIGYIEVSEFASSTLEQFEQALADLTDQGMKGLIIDLRYNPGGVLDTVCDMLDDILPAGLLVYTENRSGQRVDFDSTDDTFLDLPLVVLVNSASASASEIFAGAVQDRGAGTIIGTTTYGKGVVQTVRQLTDGSAIKVTTSRYFTPNGTCIQGIGITPDIEIEYEFLGGEDDEYSYELDNQIQEALRVLKEETGP